VANPKSEIRNPNFLTLPVPHRSVRGVLDDDSHPGEPFADVVGQSEIARCARGVAVVHQALDLVVAVCAAIACASAIDEFA